MHNTLRQGFLPIASFSETRSQGLSEENPHLYQKQALKLLLSTRRPTTAWTRGVPPPAGGPRIAPSARRGTKPQTPYSQGPCSASLSYRPTLAEAAFCNPIAPAPWCPRVRPLIPLVHPLSKVQAVPPSAIPLPHKRRLVTR